MAYSKQLIDHYENPRNVGSLDKETVVVTTSIGYPCQNSITEKRKP
mgnify:CR=1 FL=1